MSTKEPKKVYTVWNPIKRQVKDQDGVWFRCDMKAIEEEIKNGNHILGIQFGKEQIGVVLTNRVDPSFESLLEPKKDNPEPVAEAPKVVEEEPPITPEYMLQVMRNGLEQVGKPDRDFKRIEVDVIETGYVVLRVMAQKTSVPIEKLKTMAMLEGIEVLINKERELKAEVAKTKSFFSKLFGNDDDE